MTMFLSELLLWDARPLVNRQGSGCGNHDPVAKTVLLSPQFPTWLRHHPPHLSCPANGTHNTTTMILIASSALCARTCCHSLGKGARVGHHNKWRTKHAMRISQ
jgi:hypothetical protein